MSKLSFHVQRHSQFTPFAAINEKALSLAGLRKPFLILSAPLQAPFPILCRANSQSHLNRAFHSNISIGEKGLAARRRDAQGMVLGDYVGILGNPTEHEFLADRQHGRRLICPAFCRGHFQATLLHTNRCRIKLAGVEFWIRQRHHNICLHQVVRDPLIHLLNTFRMKLGHVVVFADVVAQIIEPVLVLSVLAIVKGADEFPIAMMNRHRGRKPLWGVPMTRHISKHRLALHLLAAQGVSEIHAVNDVILWEL